MSVLSVSEGISLSNHVLSKYYIEKLGLTDNISYMLNEHKDFNLNNFSGIYSINNLMEFWYLLDNYHNGKLFRELLREIFCKKRG